MKILKYIFLLFITAWFFVSCSSDNDDPEVIPETPTTNRFGKIKISKSDLEYELNDFIWSALNIVYLWNADVPNLNGSTFDDSRSILDEFLVTFDDSEEFFYSLLYQYRIVDRFSWIVDDYTKLEQSFQGITRSTGMEFGLAEYPGDENKIYGYVRYVVPNSPAENAGIIRGDFFTAVNNTNITRDNYSSLLFDNANSYEFTFSNYSNNQFVFEDKKTVEAVTINENPVYLTKVINKGGKKIGYLMYNSFTHNYNLQLNNALGELMNENIDEFVLDLRYNPGGRVSTARLLSSSIAGETHKGDLFMKIVFNEELNQAYRDEYGPDYFNDYFVDSFEYSENNRELKTRINFLNLQRVFVLVRNSSASASELVINSLEPYMDVILIGEKTYGKNVASDTYYDSDNLRKDGENFNTKHKWAIQPIIAEVENADGFSDYTDGLPVDYEVNEITYLINNGSLPALGDENDPLLSKALSLITGSSDRVGRRPIDMSSSVDYEEVLYFKPYKQNMYLDVKDLPKKLKR